MVALRNDNNCLNIDDEAKWSPFFLGYLQMHYLLETQ